MTPEQRAEIEAIGEVAAAEVRVVPRVEMLTPLDQPDRAWCNTCQLSSRLAWQVVFEVAGDFTVREVSVCTDCGEESAE